MNDASINQVMARGKLVDDNLTNQAIARELNRHNNDKHAIVLDGYPRHLAQAEWLYNYLGSTGARIDLVILLELPESESYKRLIKRHRQDDNKTAIAERLQEYKEMIGPVLNFFNRHGVKVERVDGNRPEEVVYRDIDNLLAKRHVHPS